MNVCVSRYTSLADLTVSLSGTIRQFIQDDKGLVFIGFFKMAVLLSVACHEGARRMKEIGISASFGGCSGRGYICIQGIVSLHVLCEMGVPGYL